ncbi:esterase family protein, partial [Rhizobium leguminosarum]|uniref:esterase family protein n=1 Tax=Rhizobium leguminosarum TaxID=384 RepID=UPI001C93A1B9
TSKARARLATRGIASRGATSACIGIRNHPERGVSVGVFSGIANQRLADQWTTTFLSLSATSATEIIGNHGLPHRLIYQK